MAKDNKTEEELKNNTRKMAKLHAKISDGEEPADTYELEDQVDDMWYHFAIPDFENNPDYEEIDVHAHIEKLKLQDLYKEVVTAELKKRYGL